MRTLSMALLGALATGVLLLTSCSDSDEPGSAEGFSPPNGLATLAAVPTAPPAPTLPPAPTDTPDPLTPLMGVYFISKDGSTLRHIVEGEVFRADLSPDGSEVVYQRDNQVVATSIATGGTRVIAGAPAPGHILRPVWSATGRYITFSMDEERGVKSTWIVNRDGSGMRLLFAQEGRAFYVTDWLPDDSAAIAVSDRLVTYGAARDVPAWHIFRVTPGGQISPPLAEFQICYCDGWLTSPLVSPDGTRIAIADDTRDVYVLNVDGSDMRNLTRSPEEEWLIDWADDRHVVFARPPESSPGLEPGFFRLNVDDGSIAPVDHFSRAVDGDGEVVRGLVSACATPPELVVQTPDGHETDLLRGRIPGDWYLSDAEWLPDSSGLVFTLTRHDLCT